MTAEEELEELSLRLDEAKTYSTVSSIQTSKQWIDGGGSYPPQFEGASPVPCYGLWWVTGERFAEFANKSLGTN